MKDEPVHSHPMNGFELEDALRHISQIVIDLLFHRRRAIVLADLCQILPRRFTVMFDLFQIRFQFIIVEL